MECDTEQIEPSEEIESKDDSLKEEDGGNILDDILNTKEEKFEDETDWKLLKIFYQSHFVKLK